MSPAGRSLVEVHIRQPRYDISMRPFDKSDYYENPPVFYLVFVFHIGQLKSQFPVWLHSCVSD